MKSVKVTNSGGIGSGTKVVDAETGAELRCVESLSIAIDGRDSLVRADIKLCKVEAKAHYFMPHPHTGKLMQVSRVESTDGENFEFA